MWRGLSLSAAKPLVNEAGGVVLAALVAFLLMGKLGASPFMVLVVPDSSMKPALMPGDLVVAEAGRPGVGELGVWCTTPFYCVVRRVAGYRGHLAFTKSDGKGLLDSPVPSRLLRYRVAARVPVYGWLPPLLAVLGIAGYLWLYNGRMIPGSLAFRVFVLLLLSALVFTLLTPLSVSEMTPPFEEPKASLKKITIRGLEGEVDYVLSGLHLEGVRSCRLYELSPPGRNWECEAYVTESSVRFKLPEELWRDAVEKGPMRLRISLSLRVRPCRLDGTYIASIAPLPLRIARIGGRLVFENPNPVPVNVTVRVEWADSPGLFNVESYVLRIPASGRTIFTPPRHRYVYVDVTYNIGGRNYRYRVKVG